MTSLYVDRRGIRLEMDGDALVFYESDARVGVVPIGPLTRVILHGDVQLSTSVLGKLGRHGIGVIVLSGRNSEPSLLLPRAGRDAARRLAQLRAADDVAFCLEIARKLVADKLRSQADLLGTLADSRPQFRHHLLKARLQLLKISNSSTQAPAPSIPSLRGIEGAGARTYFAAIAAASPPSLGFTGRNRRPPRDPLNAVLSLGYTLLLSETELALQKVGLDPCIGFYHEPDERRASLACDLIEPLRPAIDAMCLDLFARQELCLADFSSTDNGCLLGKEGRKRFYREYESRAADRRQALGQRLRDIGRLLGPTPIDIEIEPVPWDSQEGPLHD